MAQVFTEVVSFACNEAYLDIATYTEILKGIENDGLYHSSVLLQDSIIK